jgi:hypothetical protein
LKVLVNGVIVVSRNSYALVDSLQEAESLENRFEQVLSPAMRLLSARPQLNYFPTTQLISARFG